jgi:DNA-directed RNA polymerase subunit RPC12/RpoP
MVFSKLKSGAAFCCPKCGSKRFTMKTHVTLLDTVEFDGNSVDICWDDTSTVDLGLDAVDEVECENCGEQIPRDLFIEIVKRLREDR